MYICFIDPTTLMGVDVFAILTCLHFDFRVVIWTCCGMFVFDYFTSYTFVILFELSTPLCLSTKCVLLRCFIY